MRPPDAGHRPEVDPPCLAKPAAKVVNGPADGPALLQSELLQSLSALVSAITEQNRLIGQLLDQNSQLIDMLGPDPEREGEYDLRGTRIA